MLAALVMPWSLSAWKRGVKPCPSSVSKKGVARLRVDGTLAASSGGSSGRADAEWRVLPKKYPTIGNQYCVPIKSHGSGPETRIILNPGPSVSWPRKCWVPGFDL